MVTLRTTDDISMAKSRIESPKEKRSKRESSLSPCETNPGAFETLIVEFRLFSNIVDKVNVYILFIEFISVNET